MVPYGRKEKNIMRKIIGIIFISLMFANIGYAEMRVIEESDIRPLDRLFTICVDGYKFVVWRPLQKEGNSMVQAFEERDGKSLPTKC